MDYAARTGSGASRDEMGLISLVKNENRMDIFNQSRFESISTTSFTHIGYEITAAEIRDEDFSLFLEFWDFDRIAVAGRLHDAFNKVVFAVTGYEKDKRALFEIPEVRVYLSKLAHQWPYFFYADNLQTPFLDRLIKCMCPNLTVKYTAENPTNYQVAVKTSEVNQACNVLRDGLVRACSLDSQLDQAKFDARILLLKEYIQKERLS